MGGEFRKNGINATTGGYLHNAAYGASPEVPCYEPNSSCSMHDFTMTHATDAELVNATDILRSTRATFGDVPLAPGSIVASALADEPGWSPPGGSGTGSATNRTLSMWLPTDTSSVVQGRWVAYLKLNSMTPALLGAASWAAVEPERTHPDAAVALSLTQKRLFYWTIRFVHWDSCRYLGLWTKGLQDAAQDDTLQAYVNWNNFGEQLSPQPFSSGRTPATRAGSPACLLSRHDFNLALISLQTGECTQLGPDRGQQPRRR